MEEKKVEFRLIINVVREKFGETNPDKYYMETSTDISGFNSNSNLENDKILYDKIKDNLKLHEAKEKNLKILLRSNIFYLNKIQFGCYKGNYEENFDEIGETGLRKLEGKLLSEGYNINQRREIISALN